MTASITNRLPLRVYGDSLGMPRGFKGISYRDTYPELLKAALTQDGWEVDLYNRSKGKNAVQDAIAKFSGRLAKQAQFAAFRRNVAEGRLVWGRESYGNIEINVYEGSPHKVIVGSFCSIAPSVRAILGGIHPTDWVSLYPFRVRWGMDGAYQDGMPLSKGDITIGSDVWIGTDVLLLGGVTIGHGAVIASGSVVTRSIPPYTIAAGVPARPVRSRFPEEVKERLLRIEWWDWSEDRIRRFVPLLSSNQIEEFIEAVESDVRDSSKL